MLVDVVVGSVVAVVAALVGVDVETPVLAVLGEGAATEVVVESGMLPAAAGAVAIVTVPGVLVLLCDPATRLDTADESGVGRVPGLELELEPDGPADAHARPPTTVRATLAARIGASRRNKVILLSRPSRSRTMVCRILS